MSHLILIYTVCHLAFEFSVYKSFDETCFLNFEDINFGICFLVKAHFLMGRLNNSILTICKAHALSG